MSMTKLIEEEEALERLEAAIIAAGSAAAYARKLGVTGVTISVMRRKSSRRQPITGKVADDLSLKRVSVYRLTVIENSPEQEHYENQRAEWNRLNGIECEQSKTMRVAGEGTTGRKFPDKA